LFVKLQEPPELRIGVTERLMAAGLYPEKLPAVMIVIFVSKMGSQLVMAFVVTEMLNIELVVALKVATPATLMRSLEDPPFRFQE
jgi:hypothetical protein